MTMGYGGIPLRVPHQIGSQIFAAFFNSGVAVAKEATRCHTAEGFQPERERPE